MLSAPDSAQGGTSVPWRSRMMTSLYQLGPQRRPRGEQLPKELPGPQQGTACVNSAGGVTILQHNFAEHN